jgi:ankyrin repeat protein
MGEFGRIPLHCAAEYGSQKVTALLLAHGAYIDSVDDYHHTPAMLALCSSQENTFILLAKSSARLDTVGDPVSQDVIHYAIRYGSTACMEFITEIAQHGVLDRLDVQELHEDLSFVETFKSKRDRDFLGARFKSEVKVFRRMIHTLDPSLLNEVGDNCFGDIQFEGNDEYEAEDQDSEDDGYNTLLEVVECGFLKLTNLM